MSDIVKRRLRSLVEAIGPAPFSGRRAGVEKESLRVDRAGYISQRPHPEALGSALTHPTITTDFSEALLEFVTPAYRGVREVARSLRHLHRFTCPLIGDEVLWAASMPCMVTGDASIPIARYGRSNVGTMKHVYRRGLSHRYGRVMQTISGVHFNFSLPRPFWAAYREMEGRSAERLGAFASDRYFALVRNFHRRGWIVPLLFGASPAICRSFLGNTPHTFSELGRGTLYEPFATSLRMSDIGYKNESQRRLGISYDSPAAYVRTLRAATETPHPPYEEIGVVVDGEHHQLNANLLQIENEYYSFVRPKQIARSGEKPTVALQRRGVRYVEIRALDVDPFSPVGIEEDTMRFMEAFLIHCVLDESPPISRVEQDEIEENQRLVAVRGRDPALRLRSDGQDVAIFDRAREIADAVAEIAGVLDAGSRTGRYAAAVASCRAALDDPRRLPSARVLDELHARSEAFFEFAMRKSGEHRASLLANAAARRTPGRIRDAGRRVAARPARDRGRRPHLLRRIPRTLLRPATGPRRETPPMNAETAPSTLPRPIDALPAHGVWSPVLVPLRPDLGIDSERFVAHARPAARAGLPRPRAVRDHQRGELVLGPRAQGAGRTGGRERHPARTPHGRHRLLRPHRQRRAHPACAGRRLPPRADAAAVLLQGGERRRALPAPSPKSSSGSGSPPSRCSSTTSRGFPGCPSPRS